MKTLLLPLLFALLAASPAYAISQETLDFIGAHWWHFIIIFGCIAGGFGYMDESHNALGYCFFIGGFAFYIYLYLHQGIPVPVEPESVANPR